MRVMLKVSIPVAAGNAAARAGTLGATIQSILQDVKPEAVYFTDFDGKRTALIFMNLQDGSQIPAMAEPWMLAFDASIECHPIMTPDDLAKATADIERVVKKYS